jgi:flagellar operon protein
MNDIRGLTGLTPAIPSTRENSGAQPAPGFQDLLKEKIGPQPVDLEVSKLKFSNHAVDRMRSRGISLEPEELIKLEQAVDKAQKKGSKETLILSGDSAFIVNVKNKTVVTAMDRQLMKENVFTNIDSTIVL